MPEAMPYSSMYMYPCMTRTSKLHLHVYDPHSNLSAEKIEINASMYREL